MSCESTHGVWSWICHQNFLWRYKNWSEEMKWVLVIMCGFIFNLLSRYKVSYNSDWPGTYYVAGAKFVFRTSCLHLLMLGFQVCATMLAFFVLRKKMLFNKDFNTGWSTRAMREVLRWSKTLEGMSVGFSKRLTCGIVLGSWIYPVLTVQWTIPSACILFLLVYIN